MTIGIATALVSMELNVFGARIGRGKRLGQRRKKSVGALSVVYTERTAQNQAAIGLGLESLDASALQPASATTTPGRHPDRSALA